MASIKTTSSRDRRRGFTLIEVLVTITIIIILGLILLAVGSSVHKNSQIAATRAELKSLEGLVQQFQDANNTTAPETLWGYNGSANKANALSYTPSGDYTNLVPGPTAVNFVDVLYRYPGTKDQLIKLLGDKLVVTGATGAQALDYFGKPISYIPKGVTTGMGGTWTPPAQDYLRSSGPDGWTDWADGESAPPNSDDILSYEAPH